jgi:hypothetical protein
MRRVGMTRGGIGAVGAWLLVMVVVDIWGLLLAPGRL